MRHGQRAGSNGCWRPRTAERGAQGSAGKNPTFTRPPSAFRLGRPRVQGTSLHIHAATPWRYLRRSRARIRRSAEQTLPPLPRRADGAAQRGAAQRPAPLLPLAHGSGKSPSAAGAARARPRPPPAHNLPWLAGGGAGRGGRLPILMVLGNPARASPSSPASSSRRVRAALCPIFFSRRRSAPTAERAAQAWAQLGAPSSVSGGGDAGGGTGEDGPSPFFPSSFLFFPSFSKFLSSSSRQPGRAHWLRGCRSPPVSGSPPSAGTSPKDGG